MIGLTPRQTGEHPAARLRATPLERLRTGGRTGHFVRDHFGAPQVDPELRLVVDGAVARPAELDRAALEALPRCERTVVLECAGHRRAEYDPPRRGVQWEAGAVGEARWGGARLADVLARCEPSADAVEVVLHGADGFARSLPVEKARDPETLLAWTVDGEPLPEEHGAPLRAIVPGWYGTDAVKWLTRVEVVTEPFTGRWQAEEYRWIEPGEEGLGRRMGPMPVHALVTEYDREAILGVAWSDGTPIARVEVRVDGGEWAAAVLTPPAERWAFTRWRLAWSPQPGRHRIEVRATDAEGRTQPDAPPPNVRGFGNHSVHRVDAVVA
ncbi:MAG: sulfite oxidase [Solirubrobacteraceae bacterium]|nr:sulfite oxidase [Solirubrobacteraceae bacterium]